MLDKAIREQIIALINKEVVPAMGCTEPMAVALCTAKATEQLGRRPEKISVLLSANMLKNAMGVGIPGTGMIGLPIAVGLGALIGKSEYELEVIKDLTPESLEVAKQYIKTTPIDIQLKSDCTEKLYIEVTVEAEGKSETAIIEKSHTNFVNRPPQPSAAPPLEGEHLNALKAENSDNYFPLVSGCKAQISVNSCKISSGEKENLCNLRTPALTPELAKNSLINNTNGVDQELSLCLKMVYDFATTTPIDEIRFILKTKEYNFRAAEESLKNNYGHCLGKTIDRPLARGIFGNSIYSHIISKTASACDARMGGAMIPVMSNSGSGNQGICATNPVAVYALENENTEEETIRALVLSHLTAIYIKQSLGKLSALCGCVVASIGSSCGITYLMGGDYEHICYSVKNMIANLTGMICDGAKPSCSLKITSGVSTALLSALLSMEGRHVTSAEGIIDDDVDKSIHNLTSIGSEAMDETDAMVLNIMTCK